jgi:zinc protease
MLIGIAAPGKDLTEVEKFIYEEINKVISNGVTQDELTKAKNITESEFISDKKSVLGKARDLADYESSYGNPNLINTDLKNYMDVKIADIKKVAKKYLETDKNVTLIYVPKDK